MEDDLMRLFGTDRLQGIVGALKMPEDMHIDAKILSGAIEGAQKRIEDSNFKRRRYVLSYDDVMNQQRNIIYGQRQDVLNGEDISGTIQKMILSNVEEIVLGFTQSDDAREWELDALRAHFMGLLTNEEDFRYTEDELKHMKRDRIVDELCERAMASYGEKEKLFGTETFREVERAILLRNVDTAWMEHIDIMDDLKGNVGLQAYAQRDPINEFRIQGANLFDDMVSDIRQKTVRTILSVVPREQPIRRVQVANPITAGLDSGEGRKKTVVKRASTTVVKDASATGRNDPCPCGSGKKYKNCCMRKNEG
jgi:preprotein translocase subunit SecA